MYRLWIFAIILFSCTDHSQKTLTIAVASSAQYAIEEIVQVYQNTTGQNIEIVVGSSGKLTAQIEQGAPFDLFLSADMDYPIYLFEKGLMTQPDCYAVGQLVLWSNEIENVTPESLMSDKIKFIAMPNPKNAPYGVAAKDYLDGKGLNQDISAKFVYCENVGQATQFVMSSAAEIGFSSQSLLLEVEPVSGTYKIPTDEYEPIQHGVSVRNGAPSQASSFLTFLKSPEAQTILVKYGFNLPSQ